MEVFLDLTGTREASGLGRASWYETIGGLEERDFGLAWMPGIMLWMGPMACCLRIACA